MNGKLQLSIFLLFCLNIITLQGCEKKSSRVRAYHEIFVSAPQKMVLPASDPHAFLGEMPQDEIHANLKTGNGKMGSEMQNRLQQSVAPAPITWSVPKGWSETAGSGMRLVTFTSKETKYPIETTIVSLAGQAGGLSANVERWLRQLNLTLESPEQINQFISRQESVAIPMGKVIILDFTQWGAKTKPETPSMIAAIIDREESQIFIKMTGTTEALQQNLQAYRTLIQSLKMKSTP